MFLNNQNKENLIMDNVCNIVINNININNYLLITQIQETRIDEYW